MDISMFDARDIQQYFCRGILLASVQGEDRFVKFQGVEQDALTVTDAETGNFYRIPVSCIKWSGNLPTRAICANSYVWFLGPIGRRSVDKALTAKGLGGLVYVPERIQPYPAQEMRIPTEVIYAYGRGVPQHVEPVGRDVERAVMYTGTCTLADELALQQCYDDYGDREYRVIYESFEVFRDSSLNVCVDHAKEILNGN